MSSTDPILALRVAEAKAIKKDRDRKELQAAARHPVEGAEAQRARTERIAAGLLGRCPSCRQEVDTADGIVLRHISDVAPSKQMSAKGLVSLCSGSPGDAISSQFPLAQPHYPADGRAIKDRRVAHRVRSIAIGRTMSRSGVPAPPVKGRLVRVCRAGGASRAAGLPCLARHPLDDALWVVQIPDQQVDICIPGDSYLLVTALADPPFAGRHGSVRLPHCHPARRSFVA